MTNSGIDLSTMIAGLALTLSVATLWRTVRPGRLRCASGNNPPTEWTLCWTRRGDGTRLEIRFPLVLTDVRTTERRWRDTLVRRRGVSRWRPLWAFSVEIDARALDGMHEGEHNIHWNPHGRGALGT